MAEVIDEVSSEGRMKVKKVNEIKEKETDI